MSPPQLPFDADDFSLQARSALSSLQHVMQVVINAGALLEHELGHPLDPPAPRRFLYPRAPEKTAVTAGDHGLRVSADSKGQETSQPGERAQAALLRELHERPPSARFTPEEAAAYLRYSTSLLRSWRWNGRGPPFEGKGRLVRYTKAGLDEFMAR